MVEEQENDRTGTAKERSPQPIVKALTEEDKKEVAPTTSRPLRLYRLLKIHKDGMPLRPIVSSIGSLTYDLSKYLATLLKQYWTSNFLREEFSAFCGTPSQFSH